MKLIQKIKDAINSSREILGNIALFVIGWIICFDTIGGTFIPIAYGKDCAWFAIPNLIIDIFVIYCFVCFIKVYKDEDLY